MPPTTPPVIRCIRIIAFENKKYLYTTAASPDAKIVAISIYNTAEKGIWSLETGEKLHKLDYQLPKSMTAGTEAITISPDGQKVALVGVDYGKSYVVNVWHTQTGKHLFSDSTYDEAWHPQYTAAAFCADSLTLVVGGTRLDIWNIRTGQIQPSLNYGARLAISLNNRIVHTHLNSWWFNTVPFQYPVCTRADMPHPIGSVAITLDGKICAAGLFDGSVQLWHWDTYQKLHTLEAVHSNSVCRLAFSPDGKWLVSGSVDQPLKVWEVKTGALLTELPASDGHVTGLSFSQDGCRLVISDNRTVQIWQIDSSLADTNHWVTPLSEMPAPTLFQSSAPDRSPSPQISVMYGLGGDGFSDGSLP
jgi:WD40 repeat protein